jgi:hypothetical protein
MFSIHSVRGGDGRLHIEFHRDNFNMASNVKMLKCLLKNGV